MDSASSTLCDARSGHVSSFLVHAGSDTVNLPQADLILLLREIRAGVVDALMPDLASERSRDLAAHIERLLTLIIVAGESGAEMAERYSGRFRDAVTKAHMLVGAPDPDVAGFEDWRSAAQQAVHDLHGGCGAPAETLALTAGIMAVERDFQEEVAQRRDTLRDDIDAPARDVEAMSCSFSPPVFEAYVRRVIPGAGEARLLRLTPIPGGRSKETVIVDMEDGGSGLPDRFVIRKDRTHGVTDATVVNEYELLKAVHRAGRIPAPEPLWIERDSASLGSAFLLVRHLRGAKEGEYHLDVGRPADARREIALQMARLLAHIHAIPRAMLAATNLDTAPDLRGRIDGHIERIANQFANSDGPPSISAAVASGWLRDHSDWGLLAPPGLVHGDFGLHNLLIDSGVITGVVDWELASVGSPSIDLAMCRRMTAYMDVDWSDFVEAYLEADGRPEACDPRSIAFYQVYGLVSGTVRSRYGGHLFRTGAKRDLITANSGFDFHYRSSRLLANALLEALALDKQALVEAAA